MVGTGFEIPKSDNSFSVVNMVLDGGAQDVH
jgi:hypothetical protein